MSLKKLDEVAPKPTPRCPDCGEPMVYYGGTAGYVHCGWKLLYRAGGWFEDGVHVKDQRLRSGVAGVVREVPG